MRQQSTTMATWCILCASLLQTQQAFARTSPVTFSVEKPSALQPVFLMSTSDVPLNAAGREQLAAELVVGDGKVMPVRILPLTHFGQRKDKQMSMWLLDVPKLAAGREIVVFRRVSQAQREELGRLKVATLEGQVIQDCESWGTTDVFLVLARCLERNKAAVNETTQSVMRQVAAKATHKPYQRMANYVLGCLESEKLEKQFNNNGPVGAFRSCYPMLEAVNSPDGEDPLWLDAQMRLLRAKAWSSDYEDAKIIARRIEKSELSEKYARMAARVAAEELSKLEQERKSIRP